MVVDSDESPGWNIIELIPREYTVDILLRPFAAATELRPYDKIVLRFCIPYVAFIVLASIPIILDKELIGTNEVILEIPGAITELIDDKPGCTETVLRVLDIVVLRLLAPGTDANDERPIDVTVAIVESPGLVFNILIPALKVF